MAILAVKRVFIDNVSYPVKADTVEVATSGGERTPVVGNDGKVGGFTESLEAGMIKAEFIALSKFKASALKKADGIEIIVETKDGRTFVGIDMTQGPHVTESFADGVIPLEFYGNVEEK